MVVLAHNVWAANWRVIITLFGWVLIVCGTIRIVFPQLVQKYGGGTILHLAALPVIGGALVLVLGLRALQFRLSRQTLNSKSRALAARPRSAP